MSTRTDGYVYCIHDLDNNICRIGKTAFDAKGRVEGQIGYYPFRTRVTKIYVLCALEVETYLHDLFYKFNVKNSWYSITTEMFVAQVELYENDLKKHGLLRFGDEEKRGVRE